MSASEEKESEGICAFCERQAQLRQSHVLPAFIFRWLRGRSGKGHIRMTDNPNLRVQDGLKLRWLCGDCESRFSQYETAFATKLFYPWHAGKHAVPYGDWLLKFCVSVSWRVLSYARGQNKNTTYSDEKKFLMQEAKERWRGFLSGEKPHPGAFEQHILIFDFIETTSVPDLPININRFMTGAVTFDIVGSERCLMTFAKLGRFIIFGIIQHGADQWEGTKVHVRQGLIKPDSFTVPYGILGMLRDKATHAATAMEGMSVTQATKVDQNVRNNIDAFAKSDQFASMMADARMFGMNAILRKK